MKRGPLPYRRRLWSPADIATAEAMRLAGKSTPAIALVLGRTPLAIGRFLHKRGILMDPEHRRGLYAANLARIRQVPEVQERRRAGMKAAYSDERRVAASERAKRYRIWEKGNAAQPIEMKRAAQRLAKAAYIEQQLGWCPAAYRAFYKRERERLHSATKAKQVTLDQIAADEAQRLEAEAARNGWSPAFRALLAKVAAGEVKVVERPVVHAREPDQSPMGCATGMLG